MSELSHLWQRFLLTSALVVGLFIGAAATIFGYSNLSTVNVRWSVFHIDGIPLWTVAVVPLAVVLVAGTLYHWMDGLHHFTEHMRHRRRVHELEAELVSLRTHLDQVLEMPDHSTSDVPARPKAASLPARDEGLAELAPEVAEDAAEPAKPEPAVPQAAAAIAEPATNKEITSADGGRDSRPRKGRDSKAKRATLTPAEASAQADNGAAGHADKSATGAEEADIPVLGV